MLAKREGNIQKQFMASFIICSILWFVLTLLIFFRIIQSNHFPLANFYEALIFLTWCLVTLNFIILLEPIRSSSFNFSVQKQVSGAILAPCILFIIAFAQFNLSADITPLVPALKSNWLLMHVSIMIGSYTTFMVGGLLSILLLMQTIYSYSQTWSIIPSKSWKRLKFPTNRVHQLRSNLKPVSDLSDFEFSIQSEEPIYQIWKLPIQSIFNLFQSWTGTLQFGINSEKSSNQINQLQLDSIKSSYNHTQKNEVGQIPTQNEKFNNHISSSDLSFDSSIRNINTNTKSSGFPSFEHVLEGPDKMQKKNFYIILDNLSYRMMGIGFPLFTLGILSGAVWANEAWGSYWSWDIKEVGSFINWLLVALYFHCRYKNFISLSHMVAFISLIVLFFNFFGISLGIFGSSLHAYGASS